MTAGAAQIAWAAEDSYRDLGDVPTWRQPFTGITVESITWDNQLSRDPTRQPDSPTAPRSAEGNALGTFTITGTLVDEHIYDIIFPASGTGLPSDGSSEWPSSTWYFDADVPGINQERFAEGAYPTEVSWQYTQGGEIQMSLTMEYAYEPDGVDAPGSISQPSESDVFMWHSMDLTRNGTDVASEELASFELSLSNLARGRRGQSRYITRPVVAAIEPSFTFAAPFVESAQLELAYGSSAATTPSDDAIDQTDFEVSFVNASGDTHTFTLSGAQPTTYGWNELVGEEDLSEDVQFHVADVSVVVS